jgi:tetratricopeptide (TPR) repeat protein
LQSVEEALRLNPRLAPALTLNAKLAMAVRNYSVARHALLLAVEAAPESWYARFLLGFTYYLQNELHPALPELERAARLNPKESKPLLYLGLTHESLGNSAKAVEYYRSAIRAEEASGTLEAETLLTAARLLLLMDQLEECGKLVGRAVKLAPAYRDGHYERARLLLKQGRFAEAAQAGEKALALAAAGASDGQVRYLLVRAYGMMGDERRAAGHAAALRREAEPQR